MAALTSPVRLDIFRLLMEQEPVGLVSGEIAEYLGQTHNGISFHLKSLQHAGLVTVQPGGAPPTLSRGHARSLRPSGLISAKIAAAGLTPSMQTVPSAEENCANPVF
ncbi:MAG: winged helix-turn-helix domain-containing protein [Acidithiobacillus ferrivorans]